MRKLATCAAVVLFALTGFVRAQDASTQPSTIDVTDKAAITAAKDKDVVVEGMVDRAEWSKTGKVMNITFRDSDLVAAAFEKNKQKLDAAFNGDLAKSLAGAKVRLKGKMADYRGKPQIVISSAEQITIVEAAASTTQPAQ